MPRERPTGTSTKSVITDFEPLPVTIWNGTRRDAFASTAKSTPPTPLRRHRPVRFRPPKTWITRFAANDFSFSDTDTGDTLSSVTVETLPTNGSLTLSGAAVSANATVTKAHLDSGDLKYTPPANAYGDDYASFTFKVNDGEVDSASAYTMTINVTAVNDAPVLDSDIPDQTATAGTAFSYAFPTNAFSDSDNGTLTYAAAPSGGGTLPTSRVTFNENVANLATDAAGNGNSAAARAMSTYTMAPPIIVPTSITLVSNSGEGITLSGTTSISAQSISTGGHLSGYTVSQIALHMYTVASRSTTVKLYSNSDSGEPQDLVATLVNPATLSQRAFNTFTAPSGTMLSRNTTYWIVVNEDISDSSIERVSYGNTRSKGDTSSYGWSIGDGRLIKSTQTASWELVQAFSP